MGWGKHLREHKWRSRNILLLMMIVTLVQRYQMKSSLIYSIYLYLWWLCISNFTIHYIYQKCHFRFLSARSNSRVILIEVLLQESLHWVTTGTAGCVSVSMWPKSEVSSDMCGLPPTSLSYSGMEMILGTVVMGLSHHTLDNVTFCTHRDGPHWRGGKGFFQSQ